MRLRFAPPRPFALSEPHAFFFLSLYLSIYLSLSLRAEFFLLAYPEDFFRAATRFCYINIGSISKRTPFYRPLTPLAAPSFALPLRGVGGGCTPYEICAN